MTHLTDDEYTAVRNGLVILFDHMQLAGMLPEPSAVKFVQRWYPEIEKSVILSRSCEGGQSQIT